MCKEVERSGGGVRGRRRGSLHGLLPEQGSAAVGGADHRRRACGGDLRGFLPGQGQLGSTALRGAGPSSDMLEASERMSNIFYVHSLFSLGTWTSSTSALDIAVSHLPLCHLPRSPTFSECYCEVCLSLAGRHWGSMAWEYPPSFPRRCNFCK